MHDFLYDADDIKVPFGDKWVGPDVFEKRVKTLIAVYEPDEDGKRVKVFAEATPAVFFIIEIENGYKLETGSGQDSLAATIAHNIASGMLVVTQADSNIY